MKKKIILLLILILCVGCTRIDNVNDYSIIIDKIINNNYNNQNTTSLGYTYYLPLGVSKVYDKDYNQKLKTEDTFMYLYVDSVSYYYHNTLNLDDNMINNSYYYHKIKPFLHLITYYFLIILIYLKHPLCLYIEMEFF